MSTQPETGIVIIRIPEIVKKIGVSKAGIYAKIKKNQFPAPIKLSDRAVGWVLSEVEAWIQQRINERGANSVRPPL